MYVNFLTDLTRLVVNVHSKKKSFGRGRCTGLACDFISCDVFFIIAVESHGDNIRDLAII
jgi:hypothetical protein